mgnify:FL=1
MSFAAALSAEFFAFVAEVEASPALVLAVEALFFALVAEVDASPALVEAVPALVDASDALVKAVVAAVFASTTFFVTSVTCNVMFPAVWVIELSFKVTSSRTFAAFSADCFALAAEFAASPALSDAVQPERDADVAEFFAFVAAVFASVTFLLTSVTFVEISPAV